MENKYKLERTNKKTGRTWIAYCVEYSNKVVVKSGSIISDQELTHLNSEIRYKRDHAAIDENRKLLMDVEVKNLAQAAMFVLATNADPNHWKKY